MNSLNILLFGIVIFAFYMLGSIMTLVICIAHYEKRSYLSATHKIWKIFSSIIKDEPPEEIFPLLIGYDPVMKIFDFAQIDAFFAPVSQLFATFYCNGAHFWKDSKGVTYRFAVTLNPNSPPLAQLEDTAEQLATVEIGKYLTSIGRTGLKPQLLVVAELRKNGELRVHVALTNTGAGQISQFKQQRQQRRAMAAQKKEHDHELAGRRYRRYTLMVFGYDMKLFSEYGVSVPISVPVSSHPHALITGASGSGKSMTLLFLLGKLLQENPETVVYFCDFKNSEDFSFLEGYSRYYAGEDCYDGLMDYYHAFSKVRADRTLHNRRRYLLIFDEYPAFVNYLTGRDKLNKTKLSNDVLGAVSEILMLGRGISFGLWVATQRADASLFTNGARDNFMVVLGLGRLSKEQKGMVFSGHDIPDMAYGAGEGVLLADGRELVAVKYPLIEDLADWKRHVVEILGSCPVPSL